MHPTQSAAFAVHRALHRARLHVPQGSRPMVGNLEVGSARDTVNVKNISKVHHVPVAGGCVMFRFC